MGYLQQEMIKEQTVNETVERLERELIMEQRRKQECQANEYLFGTMFRYMVNNGHINNDMIRAFVDDQECEDAEALRDLLVHHDICDRDVFYNEYEVTLTIPVTVTITVEELDEERAFEAAKERVEYDGLDHYYPDYDMYNAEMYDITKQ